MSPERLCATDGEIASYLEGKLSPERLDVIEAHLDACGSCASVVTQTARGSRSHAPPGGGALRIFDIGQMIAGRYEILGFLGAGGMGEVYEAQDQVLGDRVALKTVSAAASFDEPAVRRLKAEVQLARRVTHRNVCRIFDFGFHTEEGPAGAPPVTTPFLTMELLHGRPLDEHLRGGERLPAAVVADTAFQIAAGLAAAHEAGVLHRDLKSDNVMLLARPDAGFRAIITDFGLAGTIQATAPEAASSKGSSLHGTAPYLAPERLAGMPASAAADVYALGVIIWELMTGRLAGGGAEAPRSVDLAASGPLAEIVRACLEPRPELRPKSAALVLARLDRARNVPRPARRRLRRAVVAALAVSSLGLVLAMQRTGSGQRTPATMARPAASAPARALMRRLPVVNPSTVVATPALAQPSAAVRRHRQAPPRPRVDSVVAVPASTADSPAPAPTEEDPAKRGEQLIVEGKFAEACAQLERARAERPGHAPLYRLLGQCYMRSGQPDRAKQNYRTYLELAPGSPDAAFIKGILL